MLVDWVKGPPLREQSLEIRRLTTRSSKNAFSHVENFRHNVLVVRVGKRREPNAGRTLQ